MADFIYPLIGVPLIFVCTTLGSLFVYFFNKKAISARLNHIFIGFASGIMLSASFFSLLMPALQMEITYMPSWTVVGLGTILGALFLWGIDKLVPHFHTNDNQEEGIHTCNVNKTTKMFLAVTIHNIPEGLSVGIAFGVALASKDNNMLLSALLLSVGIGLQNIPEGAMVALPVKGETGSATRGFLFGMFSGIVEPVAAIFGLFLAMQITVIMPWASAFAAGCMIYVVAEEMIPEMKSDEHDHFGVWSFIIGFVFMMVLDVLSA